MKVHRSELGREHRARACLIWGPLLVLSLWLGLPALSVAQPAPASKLAPAPVAAEPAATVPEAVPPAADAPSADANAAKGAGGAATPPPRIALVLPLDSPVYGRAAEAVRAGFAAASAPTDVRVTVIAHGDGDVRAAFDRAKASGARVIVGPLVRDDLKAIAGHDGELPSTIALNQLDEGNALPPHVYSLALAIESEGMQLARLAAADGARSVAIVGSDAALQKRFASAFTGEWILQGGGPPVVFRFDRSPELLTLLKRELAKAAPDIVLLAVDGDDAALVKPYVGQAAVYTSSQVNDRQSPESRHDLDQVRFVEIPWLADPAGAAYASIRRPDYGSATLERLYALGVDAFRVAQAFGDGAPATLELDGATGHLVLDRSRQFAREGSLMQFRDGAVVAAGSR